MYSKTKPEKSREQLTNRAFEISFGA